MKKRSLDIINGSVTRAIILFSLPLLLGNIFQQAYNVADTAIAGYLLGDDALSAIGSTSSLFSFMMMFVGGLNGGFALVIARFFGESNTKSLKKSIGSMLIFDGIFALICVIFAFTLIKPALRLINTPDEIFNDAYKYVFVLFLGMLVTVCYNAEASLLRALGDSVTPIIFLVVSSVINITLDILFIGVLRLGVMGASLATVVAQAVSVMLCFITLSKNYKEYKIDKSSFKIDKELYKEMLSAGMTMALMNCIFAIGSLILQSAINGLGKAIIAGHLAARKIAEMFMQPMITIGTACSTIVSQNYGAKKYDRIKRTIKISISIELIMAIIFIAIVYIFALPMINLVTSTTNQIIIDTAKKYLYINLPFYLFLGVLYVLRTSIQSIGKRLPPLMSSSIELASKCIAAWWLTVQFGYIGVCVAEPISWALGVLLLIASFSKAYKELKKQ